MAARILARVAWVATVIVAGILGCVPPGGVPGQLSGIDQQQPIIDMGVGARVIGGSSQQILAQIVRPGRAGRLTEVRLPVACSSGNLIVEIRYVSSTTSEPVGTAVSAETIDGTTIPSSSSPVFRRVQLSVPVWVGVSDPIAIVLSSAGQCAIWSGPVGDPYASGHSYFDARPNAPHVWVRGNVGTGRDDLPFQTFVVP